MKDIISKEHTFNHPISKVWNAISRAEEISTWFIKADFKAEPGYNYTFTASEESNCTQITGVVKEANPYTLIYTWIVAETRAETTVKMGVTGNERWNQIIPGTFRNFQL